ncbi:hypothetical protein [Actinophytocola sp.]|uniref:hypothetical protein n=1 Tax=Actinophytocola sp. TaxID=1872138 RepID=UPI003D6BAFAD
MDCEGPAAPALDEQHSDFNYGYRMNCDCGEISSISAADYHIKSTIDALMPCEHCGGTIHFGPRVAALRNPDDPVLNNTQINRVAWYHTSTHLDWPSATYANDQRAKLIATAHYLPAGHSEALIEQQLNQALHVGTYESAIENMLRRMSDQDDGAAQFYLHRVTLAVPPDRVNDGYRDENHESAAQLTTSDLRQSGLSAIRYLNVSESVGSLSLAVLPEAIAYVQTVSLPVTPLDRTHDDALHNILAQFRGSLDDIRAGTPETSTVEAARLRLRQLIDPALEEIDAASAVHGINYYELWNSLVAALTERNLPNISPVVREDFDNAMSAWHREQTEQSARRFADFFAASAVALTRPHAVMALAATQQPRPITGSMSA